MYVRHGRDNLDSEIIAIFGTDETNDDGSEKSITYSEYLEKINARALENFNSNKAVVVSMGVDGFTTTNKEDRLADA